MRFALTAFSARVESLFLGNALSVSSMARMEARNIFSITASSLSVGRIGSLLRDSMEEEPLARATRKSKKPL